MYTTIHIYDHQRGLWFRRGEFQQLLAPGTYRLWDQPASFGTTIDTVDLREPRLAHPQLDALIGDPRLRPALTVVELAEDQRALVWRGRELLDVLGPGRHAYWKTPRPVTVETLDVETLRRRRAFTTDRRMLSSFGRAGRAKQTAVALPN